MVLRNYMEDSERASLPVWSTVLLSLFFHVLFVTIKWSPPSQESPRIPDPIEITQVPSSYLTPPGELPVAPPEKAKPSKPKPKAKEMRMAETDEAANSDIDPNAKFLGAKNQKAEEEMKAKQIDDFRSGEGSGAKGVTKSQQEFLPPTAADGKKTEEVLAPTDTTELGITTEEPKQLAGVKRNWKTLSLKDLGVNGDGQTSSASDDDLNGVATGNRTILSTREFRYFSYYHRIKELLRQYWKPSVEQKLYKMWVRGNAVSKDELVTSLMVLLDKTGKIQKISRVLSSGFNELDNAAIESFERAGPFPNPPKGIIEDDGFVRIRWDFVLKTEASPRIQFQSAGGANSPTDH